jgi:hypothetical protein
VPSACPGAHARRPPRFRGPEPGRRCRPAPSDCGGHQAQLGGAGGRAALPRRYKGESADGLQGLPPIVFGHEGGAQVSSAVDRRLWIGRLEVDVDAGRPLDVLQVEVGGPLRRFEALELGMPWPRSADLATQGATPVGRRVGVLVGHIDDSVQSHRSSLGLLGPRELSRMHARENCRHWRQPDRP